MGRERVEDKIIVSSKPKGEVVTAQDVLNALTPQQLGKVALVESRTRQAIKASKGAPCGS